MKKAEAIHELANYFTGTQNDHHIVGLEFGGMQTIPARKFFTLKNALLGEHVRDEQQAVERLTELMK